MSFNVKQHGFSLPVAIFILVIMALIGAAAVTINERSHQGISSEVLSTRAFYAAESGAQYALGQLFTLDGSASSCAAPYPTLGLSATGLAGCNVTVSCTSTVVATKTYYVITSSGTCAFGNTSASRQLEIMAANP